MALNNITFNKNAFGLGRAPLAENHISGILFYNPDTSLPTGFATDDRIKRVRSLGEAVDLGITDTFSDSITPSGASITIATIGAVASVFTATIDGAVIGSFTQVSGNDVNAVATGLGAAINALSDSHGYSASITTSAITLSVASTNKQGISINGGSHVASTNSGTGTTVDVQFGDGTTSYIANINYQVSEYFRMNPNGDLYIGIYSGETYDGTEIQTLQDYAEGKIRQVGVFLRDGYLASQVTASQTYAEINSTNEKPLNVLLQSNFTGLNLSDLSDLKTLDSELVSVLISENAYFHLNDFSNSKKYVIGDLINFNGKTFSCVQNAFAKNPYDTAYFKFLTLDYPTVFGHSVGNLGAILGTLSLSNLHENIGWVQNFNIASTGSFVEAGFATGDRFKDISTALLTSLNNNAYIFTRNFIGISGVYINDSFTCTLATSDYRYIENCRVSDASIRGIRANLLPQLNSPVYVDEDGKLSQGSISFFENLASQPLEALLRNGNLSAFSVVIDPNQNVLSTSQLSLAVTLVPVGVARNIIVNLSFAVKLA